MPHDRSTSTASLDRPPVAPPPAPMGAPDDGSPLIVNRLVGARRVVAVAEPTRWDEDGVDIAAATLADLLDRVSPALAAARAPVEQVLADGLDATNAWLLDQLRAWTGYRTEGRVGVGLCVAVMAGETTVFALVAPSQAIVWQGGRRYALPRLASWLGGLDTTGAAPLGLTDEVVPAIARTRAHLDDVVVVMSSATARVVAELDRRGELPASPDGLLAAVEDRFAEGAFADEAAGQCLVAVGCAEPSGRFGRTWRHVTQAASDLAWPTWIVHPRSPAAGDPARDQVEWAVGLPMDRYLASTPSWREAAEAAASAGRPRPASAAARLSRLSRRDRWASAALVVLLVLAAVGWAVDRGSAEGTPESPHLGAAREAVAAAAASSRPGDTDRLLSEAEVALARAEEDGAAAADLDPLHLEVAALRDRLENNGRLGPVELLGRLPREDGSSEPRLALHGQDLYVLDDALYRFDLAAGTLVRELAPGDQIEGITARHLVDVASDQETLLATDGAGVFWRGPDSVWRAAALAQPLPLTDGRAELFDGNLYWLDAAADQVLRFGAEAYGDAPRHWVEDGQDVDLGRAVDMAVDGSVVLLQPDGTLVELYQGHVESERPLALGGAEATARALALPASASARYVALDAVAGPGILRVDATTGDARTYLPLPRGTPGYDPTDPAVLRALTELAVDEASRTLYLVSDGAVWRTTF